MTLKGSSVEKPSGLELQVVHLAMGFVWSGSLKLKYICTHGQWPMAWLVGQGPRRRKTRKPGTGKLRTKKCDGQISVV